MSNNTDYDAAYMELVELENGDVVLRRVEDHKTLVCISFSELADKYMPVGKIDIARVMIHAGFKAFNALSAEMSAQDLTTVKDKKPNASEQKDSKIGASNAKKKDKAPKGVFADMSNTIH